MPLECVGQFCVLAGCFHPEEVQLDVGRLKITFVSVKHINHDVFLIRCRRNPPCFSFQDTKPVTSAASDSFSGSRTVLRKAESIVCSEMDIKTI